MNMVEAVRRYLIENLRFLPGIYNWDFSLDHFPDPDFVCTGQNQYERNRHLRSFIHNSIITGNRYSVANQLWYIRNWGGIGGNSEETLNTYITSEDKVLISRGTKGIATWSKILAVRDPSRYAIYDARVALALNSIQRLYNVENPVLFPQLQSRNGTSVRPTQVRIRVSGFFNNRLGSDFYEYYLSILHEAVKSIPGHDIQDAEMVLFSKAEELSRVWY